MDQVVADELTEITQVAMVYRQHWTDSYERQVGTVIRQQAPTVAIYCNTEVRQYLVVGDWHDARLQGILVAGPFLAAEELEMNQAQSTAEVSQLTPVQIRSLAAVMVQLSTHGKMLTELRSLAKRPAYVMDTHSIPDDGEEAIVNERYRRQRELAVAIEHGDHLQADMLTSGKPASFFTPFAKRVPTSPLRSAKNIGFAYNTMCRMGAERSGLRPIYLHIVSEKYAIKIEQTHNLAEIWRLIRSMAQEYCDLVTQYGEQSYSRLVNETVNYVRLRYAQPLTLPQIATAVKAEPTVLSRQFKQETGQALFTYIKQQRILQAQQLLRHGTLTIGEIAVTVGFNDQGYFARCFKQVTHETPTAYAQRLPGKP